MPSALAFDKYSPYSLILSNETMDSTERNLNLYHLHYHPLRLYQKIRLLNNKPQHTYHREYYDIVVISFHSLSDHTEHTENIVVEAVDID